ncbi:hypothetical protein GGR56DRAFT_673537 [Xylariaceae sp. FL0804]|nr:hypothetical protein GGR56DRAFT_673537 [Xylariaceae sp. FL0804]
MARTTSSETTPLLGLPTGASASAKPKPTRPKLSLLIPQARRPPPQLLTWTWPKTKTTTSRPGVAAPAGPAVVDRSMLLYDVLGSVGGVSPCDVEDGRRGRGPGLTCCFCEYCARNGLRHGGGIGGGVVVGGHDGGPGGLRRQRRPWWRFDGRGALEAAIALQMWLLGILVPLLLFLVLVIYVMGPATGAEGALPGPDNLHIIIDDRRLDFTSAVIMDPKRKADAAAKSKETKPKAVTMDRKRKADAAAGSKETKPKAKKRNTKDKNPEPNDHDQFPWKALDQEEIALRTSFKEKSLSVGLARAGELTSKLSKQLKLFKGHDDDSEDEADELSDKDDLQERLDDYRRAFCADVIFMNEQDIKKELEEFFEFLKLRERIRTGDDDDDEYEEGDLDEIQAHINLWLDKIKIVWGLGDSKEKTLLRMTADELVASKPEVLEHLGTTTHIFDSEPQSFARKIQPFLDSSQESHDTSAHSFSLWPLIKEVRVYTKSPILQNGLTLVDLPGEGDAVEARGAVAKNYYKKLAYLLIAAPAVRGSDEKKAMQLITENQEIEMKMDGQKFAVVLTKIDDITQDTTFTQAIRHRDNTELQSDIAQIQSLQASHETLRKMYNEHKGNTSTLQSQGAGQDVIDPEKSAMHRVADEMQRNREDYQFFTGRKAFLYMQERNKFVTNRIHERSQKQKGEPPEGSQSDVSQRKIEVFPTSATAYWKLSKGEEELQGFPTETYTGIPALRKAIIRMTLAKRERHATEMLNKLVALFDAISIWMAGNDAVESTGPLREEIEVNTLPMVYEKLQKVCFPTKLETSMCLKSVADAWNDVLNQKIPELSRPEDSKLDELWAKFERSLVSALKRSSPGLSWRFKSQLSVISHVKAQVEDLLSKALRDISLGSREVYPALEKDLTKRMAPVFKDALKITGKRSMRKRHTALKKGLGQTKRKMAMFTRAFAVMEKQLKEHINSVDGTLAPIPDRAVELVAAQVKLILNNATTSSASAAEDAGGDRGRGQRPSSEAALARKRQAQDQVRPLLEAWQEAWVGVRMPAEARELAEPCAIPATYISMKEADRLRLGSDES